MNTSGNFEAEFKVNMCSDREVREWVKECNKKNKADNNLWKKAIKGKHGMVYSC